MESCILHPRRQRRHFVQTSLGVKMRIVHTTPVEFSGNIPQSFVIKMRSFDLRLDNGEIIGVDIPDIKPLIDQFLWLDENDALRHLKNPCPQWTTNDDEISLINRENSLINQMLLERNYYDKSTMAGIRNYHHAHKEIPPRKWNATWTFFSREHAVLFKLAMGGNI